MDKFVGVSSGHFLILGVVPKDTDHHRMEGCASPSAAGDMRAWGAGKDDQTDEANAYRIVGRCSLLRKGAKHGSVRPGVAIRP